MPPIAECTTQCGEQSFYSDGSNETSQLQNAKLTQLNNCFGCLSGCGTQGTLSLSGGGKKKYKRSYKYKKTLKKRKKRRKSRKKNRKSKKKKVKSKR